MASENSVSVYQHVVWDKFRTGAKSTGLQVFKITTIWFMVRGRTLTFPTIQWHSLRTPNAQCIGNKTILQLWWLIILFKTYIRMYIYISTYYRLDICLQIVLLSLPVIFSKKKALQGFPSNHESFAVNVTGRGSTQRYLYNIIDIFGMVHTVHTLPNIPKYTETKIPLRTLVPYPLPAIVAVAAVVGVLVATAGPGHRSEWEDLAGHLGATNGWYPMVY